MFVRVICRGELPKRRVEKDEFTCCDGAHSELSELDDFTRDSGLRPAITAIDVFEHMQRPLEIGRRLISLLRPGGIFDIDVPNAQQVHE